VCVFVKSTEHRVHENARGVLSVCVCASVMHTVFGVIAILVRGNGPQVRESVKSQIPISLFTRRTERAPVRCAFRVKGSPGRPFGFRTPGRPSPSPSTLARSLRRSTRSRCSWG
jgi:hypothetical protein